MLMEVKKIKFSYQDKPFIEELSVKFKKNKVGDNCRVVKDNLFPVPPLFRTIKEQSDTDWSEMYKVFNMGHRLEVYLSPEHAEEVIAISKSFNIDAQIVGRIEESDKKELIIKSEFGEFRY